MPTMRHSTKQIVPNLREDEDHLAHSNNDSLDA